MIAQNAGAEGSIVVAKVRESKDKNFGYNAATDTYEDLVKAGVIDPTKVTRTALQNAASIAGLLLTTECVVVEKKEDKPAPAVGLRAAAWAGCTKPDSEQQRSAPGHRPGRFRFAATGRPTTSGTVDDGAAGHLTRGTFG